MKELEYLNPDFSNCRRVHDWKNHVGDNTKVIWHTFTEDQKKALYLDAEFLADREEWD